MAGRSPARGRSPPRQPLWTIRWRASDTAQAPVLGEEKRMAWVRVGDEALSHPKLMGIYDVDGGDRFSPLTVFGFLMALATYSAKHLTDGIIERGAAFKTGDARSTVTSLIDVCVAAGLLAWVDIEGVRKLKMFTSEEFIHIQPKE